MKDDYHHGDLRRVLLEAAEAELVENGIEGFSLRKVAKRAEVSHAAPAHHFGDANGLLTALAEIGYERFVHYQVQRELHAADSPKDKLLALGLGYVDFAQEHTALFRLMFSSSRPDFTHVALSDAAGAAFNKLADSVAPVAGAHPFQNESAMELACALWASAHGLADLLSSQRMGSISCLPQPAKEAAVKRILAASIEGV